MGPRLGQAQEDGGAEAVQGTSPGAKQTTTVRIASSLAAVYFGFQ